MAAQADLCSACLETPKLSPKDRFSHVAAQNTSCKLFLRFFVTWTAKNHISNDQTNFYLKTDRSPTAYNTNYSQTCLKQVPKGNTKIACLRQVLA